MTTIAYKDKVFAYDSLTTMGNTVLRRNADKAVKYNDCIFFVAGTEADTQSIIEEYESAKTNQFQSHNEYDSEALVLDNRQIYLYQIDNSRYYVTQLRIDDIVAIGSGARFALGAMYAGCSAEEAVKIASQLDVYTGGPINTTRIPDETVS